MWLACKLLGKPRKVEWEHVLLAGERWRSGQVEVLSPEDDSPFLLGSVAPGTARMAADTNMFRAGARLSSAFPVALSALQVVPCAWLSWVKLVIHAMNNLHASFASWVSSSRTRCAGKQGSDAEKK
jgi:hypothetical protein